MTQQPHEIDHWRNILNAIDRMLTEVPDTMLTISSYSMNLAGPSPSTEPPLPGGDALVLTGPWASDATHGDDTPHPKQTVIEWCETIRNHRGSPATSRPRYIEALRYLRDETPWILESPYATAWCEDLEAVHGRLRTLCPPEVDHRHDSTPLEEAITDEQLWEALEQHPEHELTRRDLAHLGINPSTLTTWRHRGKISETKPGRYRAGDILDARRTA